MPHGRQAPHPTAARPRCRKTRARRGRHMTAHEVNFDGLVGPTHGYAGLSYGNLASLKSRQTVSNPHRAAVEGLAKMKRLADLGVRQAVLPPQERPSIPTLRALGFDGTEQH